MARMSDEEMAEIVEQEMPGYRVADQSTTDEELDARQHRATPEASTPEVEALRSKYFPGSSSSNDDGSDHELRDDEGRGEAGAELAYGADDEVAEDAAADDDEIVPLVPKDSSDPWDRAHRPKSIVFSHKEKRVVGWQG